MNTLNKKKMIKINPMFGNVSFYWGLVLLVIFLILISLFNGLLRILLVILLFLVLFHLFYSLYYRFSARWRRLHFPLMIMYARFAGHQTALIENTGYKIIDKKFDPKISLSHLLRAIFIELSEREADEVIKNAENRLVNFSDRNEIKDFLKSKKNMTDEKIEKLLDIIAQLFNKKEEYNAFLVRYVIGEIIESRYDEAERIKYIFHIAIGQAV